MGGAPPGPESANQVGKCFISTRYLLIGPIPEMKPEKHIEITLKESGWTASQLYIFVFLFPLHTNKLTNTVSRYFVTIEARSEAHKRQRQAESRGSGHEISVVSVLAPRLCFATKTNTLCG